MNCPHAPWWTLLLPIAMFVLWHVDGYLWRRKRLFLHEYLQRSIARYLGMDRS